MATPQDTIRLHRFHELVAFDFSATETLYLDATTARAFARALLVFVEDIDNVSFVRSELGTCHIDRQTKKPNP